VKLFVDRGYRTGLGTAFYDRSRELGELAELIEAYRLLVVYGPRNAGKSELVRYYLRRHRARSIIVDARRLRAGDVLGFSGVELLVEPRELVMEAVNMLLSKVDRIGFAGLVLGLAERLESIIRSFGKLIMVIDEFHELPRYAGERGRYTVAMEDLRSVAALLSKGGGRLERIKLVVTVSEGFAPSPRAMQLLEGYSAAWMLVEPMDAAHFTMLYREYSGRIGCKVSLGEILGLAGPLPGYLADLCSIDRGQLTVRIRRWQHMLEEALVAIKQKLATSTPGEAIRAAYTTLERPVKPLAEPQAYRAGEILVEHNIAYPKYVGGGVEFRPQLNIYRVLLRLAAERNLESILDIDPEEAYRAAIEGETERQ
jgi:hypothetical protein